MLSCTGHLQLVQSHVLGHLSHKYVTAFQTGLGCRIWTCTAQLSTTQAQLQRLSHTRLVLPLTSGRRLAAICCLSASVSYLSRHPSHRAPLDQEVRASRSPCRRAQTAHSCSNPPGGGPEQTCQAWFLLQTYAAAQGASGPSQLGQRRHPSPPACAATHG